MAVLVRRHELDLLLLVRQLRHVRNRRRDRVLVVPVHRDRRRARLVAAVQEQELLQVQHVQVVLGVRHQVRVEPVAHAHSLASHLVSDQHAQRVRRLLPALRHRRLRLVLLATLARLDPSNALRLRVASAHLEGVALRLVRHHLEGRHALHQRLEHVHALHVHLHAVVLVHVRTVAHHVLVAELHARIEVLIARGLRERHGLLGDEQRAVVRQLLSLQLREGQRRLHDRARLRAGLVLSRGEEHRVRYLEGRREPDAARLAHGEHVLVQREHAQHLRAEDGRVQVDQRLVADLHRQADLLAHQRHRRRQQQRAVHVLRRAVLQHLVVRVQHRVLVVVAQVAALHLERFREHAHQHVLRALRGVHAREGHDLQRLRVHVRHVRLRVVVEVHAHAVRRVLEAAREHHQRSVRLQREHARLQRVLHAAGLAHLHEVERRQVHLHSRQLEGLVHAGDHHVRVAAVHRHLLHADRAHAVLVVAERVEHGLLGVVLLERVAQHQLARHAREQQAHAHFLVQRVVVQARHVLVEVRLLTAALHELHAVAGAHRLAAVRQLLLHKRERQVRVLLRLHHRLRDDQRAHRREPREAAHAVEVVAQAPLVHHAVLEVELVQLALGGHRLVGSQRLGAGQIRRHERELVLRVVRRLHRQVEVGHGVVERQQVQVRAHRVHQDLRLVQHRRLDAEAVARALGRFRARGQRHHRHAVLHGVDQLRLHAAGALRVDEEDVVTVLDAHAVRVHGRLLLGDQEVDHRVLDAQVVELLLRHGVVELRRLVHVVVGQRVAHHQRRGIVVLQQDGHLRRLLAGEHHRAGAGLLRQRHEARHQLGVRALDRHVEGLRLAHHDHVGRTVHRLNRHVVDVHRHGREEVLLRRELVAHMQTAGRGGRHRGRQLGRNGAHRSGHRLAIGLRGQEEVVVGGHVLSSHDEALIKV